MTTDPLDDAQSRKPFADPREFRWIRAGDLIVDQRVQRECATERVARIINEFDWNLFEALTVVERNGEYRVSEGQHRTLAVQAIDPDCLVPCMVITDCTDASGESQIALDIVGGRAGHTAYEKWRLRYTSGHEHEVLATAILESHGLRVGAHPSAMTISAVATVRSIVHGGNFSPEQGAELLDVTLDTILSAFPTYDHESNITRWNAGILLAVAQTYVRHPDADPQRLARSLRVRPAAQWVSLGKGARGEPPSVTIAKAIAAEYNRNKRRGRIDER